jgi:DNA-binding Xre family transcriptional regulator
MKWKMSQFLKAHNITAYRLQKESGISPPTVYGIARDKGERIDMNTFNRLIITLERLTGKTIVTDDLLEVERDTVKQSLP